MEVAFKSVVERIFSNWTALKLAVDHHVGGHEVRLFPALYFCNVPLGRFL